MKIRLERWECVRQIPSAWLFYFPGFNATLLSSTERWFKPWLGSRIHFDWAHLEFQSCCLFTSMPWRDGECQTWSECYSSGNSSQPFSHWITSFLDQHSEVKPRSKFIVIRFCVISPYVCTNYTQTLTHTHTNTLLLHRAALCIGITATMQKHTKRGEKLS